MKSKARKRQDWTYHHTLEIIALNEELERQAREQQAAAAAAAAAPAAAAIPPGQDHLEQLAPEVLQTPPHPQEKVLQPPPKPIKTPPTPPRARLAATQQQRLQQAMALVNVTLAEVQPPAPSVVSSPAKAGSPNTSVTSSSSASSEASAFLTPQQDASCKLLPPKTADRGFFKSIQNTLAAGLGSLASDFNAAGPSKSESQSVVIPPASELQSLQISDGPSSTAAELISHQLAV